MESSPVYRVPTLVQIRPAQQSLSKVQPWRYSPHALTDIDAVRAAIMTRKEKRIVCVW